MRSTMTLAVLFLAVIGLSACGEDLPGSGVGRVEQKAVYGDCDIPPGFTLTDICGLYHGGAPGLKGIASCMGEACFAMNRGEAVRVKFPDGEGAFPSRLFAWHDAGRELVNNYPGEECDVTQQNDNKTILAYVPPLPFCKAEMNVPGYLYHEHFASDPADGDGCLAWLECREDVP